MKSLEGRSSGLDKDATRTAAGGSLAPPDTCDEWFDRFHDYRLSLGYQSSRYAWDAWISPFIGVKAWGEVTPADAERIRDTLDRAMAERRARGPGARRLLGRSASDVWRLLLTCVRAAKRTKRGDLRALAGRPNPLEDIEPPGDRSTRQSRAKPFIYPSEAAQLFACTRVPRAWRELYAIAGYLYLRPGELLVLRWSDVDLRHGVVRVERAWGYLRQEEKGTKTRAGTRDVPIHPELHPLLDRMKGPPAALAVPCLRSVHRVSVPQIFRAHLQLAGVHRRAMHTSTMTTVRASFRSWRDSGLTWLALAGVDVGRIARRAGHEDLRMTLKYVKQAEDLTGQLGTPFAPLPRELVDA
ncbi:MAG: site-specific integrase [Kofleriaceae bacterium]|nr:site-specific integrase [Kofleriaceae bacterium]